MLKDTPAKKQVNLEDAVCVSERRFWQQTSSNRLDGLPDIHFIAVLNAFSLIAIAMSQEVAFNVCYNLRFLSLHIVLARHDEL